MSDMNAMSRDTMDRVQQVNQTSVGVVEKLFTVAQPGVVYSEPVQAENVTMIMASEVMVGAGYGFGVGAGSGEQPKTGEQPAAAGQTTPSGAGGGGGGGGYSMGRPVAVVTITPEGVQVKPVVDATKLGIALFTTIGAMWMMLGRMASRARG